MNTRKNYGRITWDWLAGTTTVASCLFLSQLAGQTPSAQAPSTDAGQQPTPIKVESRLTLVDAVVTDKKGNYVHDLTQNDFKLYEDNKEQKVASFSFGADPATPAQEQKRYLVLFFDNSTMSIVDNIQARAAAKNFIDANAGPDRLMAVADFSLNLRVLQSFTANADLLRAAAAGVNSSSADPNAQVASTGLSPASGSTAASSPFSGKLEAQGQFGQRNMLLAVRTLAKNLSGFPGRKMVVLFSTGFPLSPLTMYDLEITISNCNKANVAVYVLDARALLATPPGGSSMLRPREEEKSAVAARSEGINVYGGARLLLASYGVGMLRPQRPGGGGGTGGKGGTGGTGGGPVSNTNPTNPSAALADRTPPPTILPSFPPSVSINQQVLAMLAGGTGGFTIFNTNDLLRGLEKVGRERNEFYILGYIPHQTPEGSCHTLKIVMNRG
jgi:VWFA-related protein